MTVSEQEQNIANALINGLANLAESERTLEVVEDKARKIAELFSYTGDLKNIITQARIAVDTRMSPGVSLVDQDVAHDEEWVRRLNDADWTYNKAYEGFLRGEGWPPQMVHALGDVTLRILGHLQDSLSDGTTWSRRGLVIGHVQSGKTANYMGLVARAADAGYKFIIVIAGIHNNLRKQTQERIDEAFIGRSSDPAERRPVGVGLDRNYPNPATLTNVNDDFNKNTAAKSGWKINDFSKPIILVIKKNVRTLESLHTWLKELNAGSGDGRISDVPMLLIDDEADNASINTNKPDLDPTRTNTMIRKILRLFAKSCYVGYTATPFANIFINPDAYDVDVREELFPKDFIYCLDAPSTYFGAEKVFVNPETSEAVVRKIKDAEEFIPFSHKGDWAVTELPPSLYAALYEFIVSRAIRNLRGQANKHCSFMINVSRFVNVQRVVRNLLSMRVQQIQNAVRMCYRLPETSSSQNEHMKRLREAFDTEYVDCGATWGQVKEQLNGVFDHLSLFVINSKSDEVLDFRKYTKEGVGLTAIAIGGLSLSRGLTIDGLTVSYMYRNTVMYDTLMQMGRWFGYRPGYEDLCRVHLAPDSINWYSHIAGAADELVHQIRRMRRDGMSPKQFGLYVMAHPAALLVTAANKMRSGKTVVVKQNLSGQIVESYVVSTDPEVNSRNIKLISGNWREGFGGIVPAVAETNAGSEKGVILRDVPVERIKDLLVQFEVHSSFSARKALAIDYLSAIASTYPKGDVLLVSLGNGFEKPYELNPQERASETVKGTAWTLNKNRVASRGDEGLGLSRDQWDAAMEEAKKDAEELTASKRKEGKAVKPSDTHFRRIRKKPLLMLHSLKPTGPEEVSCKVAAFGMSFPGDSYGITVEIVANKIWLETMQVLPDDPDDEDDFDA